MIRICNKAKSADCPDPVRCAMAKPHACRHRKGTCLLRSGCTIRVRCVEVQAETARKGGAA